MPFTAITESGLLFALISWIALCVPCARELWRSVRWRRVTATVVGQELTQGDPSDGRLKIVFQLPGEGIPVRTSVWADGATFHLSHQWPVGSTLVVAYNPASPAEVTWPRHPAIRVAVIAFMFAPLFAWMWHSR